MCERCQEIEAKIARYRRLMNGVNDRTMIDHLVSFIADLDSEKSGLHPAPKE
jgi:hypothetical protein